MINKENNDKAPVLRLFLRRLRDICAGACDVESDARDFIKTIDLFLSDVDEAYLPCYCELSTFTFDFFIRRARDRAAGSLYEVAKKVVPIVATFYNLASGGRVQNIRYIE